MKQKKILSAVTAIVCTYSLCTADSSQQQTPQTIILTQTGRGAIKSRPKAPSRQVVTCAFDGESLHLTFLIPEGTASLSVTDETLLNATYVFDTTPLLVNVPMGPLQGTVYIELETEAGNTYQGELD